MVSRHNKAITTERLFLRLPELADAKEIQQLAGAWEVAETTGAIPHPYEDGMAEDWIQSIHERSEDHPQLTYAMIRREDKQLVGVCGLQLVEAHEKAEIGYWVGHPYWGKGYATEATRALIDYCFETLHLNNVYAGYYSSNTASRRVMEKAGMRYQGTLLHFMVRSIPAKNHHVYHDVGFCGILRSEWEANRD